MAGSGGHLPADKIGPFIRYQKELLQVPITCFGPQVTDISLGYDHVSAAMGQIIALLAGADEIFAVTPAEHLGMPDEEQTGRAARRVVGLPQRRSCPGQGRGDGSGALGGARSRILAGPTAFRPGRAGEGAAPGGRRKGAGCGVCGDLCAYRVMNRVGGAKTKRREQSRNARSVSCAWCRCCLARRRSRPAGARKHRGAGSWNPGVSNGTAGASRS